MDEQTTMKIPFTEMSLNKQSIREIWIDIKYAIKTPVQSAVILGVIYFLGGFRDYSTWGLVGVFFIIMIIVYFFRHSDDIDIISDTQEIYSGEGEDAPGIVNLIEDAKTYLYIVSPYISIGRNLFRKIAEACEMGVRVTILVNKHSLKRNFIKTLIEFQDIGCKVYMHPNLHSKIFLNEKTGIIGSMNLLKRSFENSLEIGVRVTSDKNLRELYDVINHFYLVDRDTKIFIPEMPPMGHCIRTGAEIVFDVNKPIEYNEYKSTYDRIGHYCHKCGKEANTMVSNPLCNECEKL